MRIDWKAGDFETHWVMLICFMKFLSRNLDGSAERQKSKSPPSRNRSTDTDTASFTPAFDVFALPAPKELQDSLSKFYTPTSARRSRHPQGSLAVTASRKPRKPAATNDDDSDRDGTKSKSKEKEKERPNATPKPSSSVRVRKSDSKKQPEVVTVTDTDTGTIAQLEILFTKNSHGLSTSFIVSFSFGVCLVICRRLESITLFITIFYRV